MRYAQVVGACSLAGRPEACLARQTPPRHTAPRGRMPRTDEDLGHRESCVTFRARGARARRARHVRTYIYAQVVYT